METSSQWVGTKTILDLDIEFCPNERNYQILPSSIHGLGIFSMDNVNVKYKGVVELMECVGPCYSYGIWTKMA